MKWTKKATQTKKQNNTGAAESSRISRAVSVYNKSSHKKLFVFLGIIVLLIIGCCILYSPAKNFYINVRENDKLQAQLTALQKTNENLSKDIESLKNEDGIKQRASEQLGLIQKGESIGVVSGTESNATAESSASSTSSKLAYKNIKTSKKWYTDFCDYIFNVHE